MNAEGSLLPSLLLVLASVFVAWSVLDVAVPTAVDREIEARAAAVERHNERMWPNTVVHGFQPALPQRTAAWLLALLLGALSLAAGRHRQQAAMAASSALVSAVVGMGALAFRRPLTVGVKLMWFSSWFAW